MEILKMKKIKESISRILYTRRLYRQAKKEKKWLIT